MKPFVLQNQSNYPGNPSPSIQIFVSSTEWNEAYNNWISGKNPTNSPEWKKGTITMIFSY